jgi:hypothetical protein
MLITFLSTALMTSPIPEIPKAEILQAENIDWYRIKKIKFSGHTYIHFKNMWGTGDCKYMHDPDCPCITDAVKKILSKFEERNDN